MIRAASKLPPGPRSDHHHAAWKQRLRVSLLSSKCLRSCASVYPPRLTRRQPPPGFEVRCQCHHFLHRPPPHLAGSASAACARGSSSCSRAGRTSPLRASPPRLRHTTSLRCVPPFLEPHRTVTTSSFRYPGVPVLRCCSRGSLAGSSLRVQQRRASVSQRRRSSRRRRPGGWRRFRSRRRRCRRQPPNCKRSKDAWQSQWETEVRYRCMMRKRGQRA